jgi:hypothetical protein
VTKNSLDNSDFNHNWRCRSCGRPLGVAVGDRLEIPNAQGSQYLVGLPAACVCWTPQCNTLNELRNSRQSSVSAV